MISIETIKHSNGTISYRGKVEAKGHSVQSALFEQRNEAKDWAHKTEADINLSDLLLDVKRACKTQMTNALLLR